MIDQYDWSGGTEAMLRFGPTDGPVIAVALPMFEEANRLRTFTVRLLRALADRDIASILPDVPGQGESLIPTNAATLANMRAAFSAVPADFSFAIRSGALIDSGPRTARAHFAPQQGTALLHELNRIRATGSGVAFAGNMLSDALLNELANATTPELAHILRYESDAKPADAKFPGAPLWRRAEPGDDLSLVTALADYLAGWVRACAS